MVKRKKTTETKRYLKDVKHGIYSKKELEKLKVAYKTGKLKFTSKEIAEAVLEDKDIKIKSRPCKR